MSEMNKNNPKDKRKLKVYTRYSTDVNRKVKILPGIRLKGEWLSNWGFECGDEIAVLNIGRAIIVRSGKEKLPVIRL